MKLHFRLPKKIAFNFKFLLCAAYSIHIKYSVQENYVFHLCLPKAYSYTFFRDTIATLICYGVPLFLQFISDVFFFVLFLRKLPLRSPLARANFLLKGQRPPYDYQARGICRACLRRGPKQQTLLMYRTCSRNTRRKAFCQVTGLT
jgi:hypothetical protein